MPGAAVLLALALASAPEMASRPPSANSTANMVIQRSLALGIDFAPPKSGKPRTAKATVQALIKANPGGWVDEQIQVADDSIGEPPSELRDYLQTHHEVVWTIIAALEKGPPEWGRKPSKADIPRLM